MTRQANNTILCTNRINIDDYSEFLKEYNYHKLSEEEQLDICRVQKMFELSALRKDFNIKTDNQLIIIADLGRWNGRIVAYKILGTRNINTIFPTGTSSDIEIYFDGYNIKAIDRHHDGVNYYEYREIRNEENIGNLIQRIQTGQPLNRNLINRYTKSIAPEVCKVFNLKYRTKHV